MTTSDLDIDDLIQRMDLEDEDDVREVVGFFLEAAAPRLTDLQRAIAARDLAQTKHHAHAAKGAAKSVGAGILAEHLVAIETALTAPDWAEMDARSNQLTASLDKVEATLSNWVPNFNKAE
jgi:HPt (histidine-containing phosphotransfer) domain-containing protein